MERLGSDLQVQVKKLVAALREITKRERQQVIDRVHEDCSKVRDELNQTLSIQQYLASLLAETDPFLLIWVRLSAQFNRFNSTSCIGEDVHICVGEERRYTKRWIIGGSSV